jgi:hypothetical protein
MTIVRGEANTGSLPLLNQPRVPTGVHIDGLLSAVRHNQGLFIPDLQTRLGDSGRWQL